MLDYLDAIRRESARFLELAHELPADSTVPSCPDWTGSDLVWHLTEVQHFWAGIVDGLLDDPDAVSPLDRPSDGALPALFAEESRRLVAALERRNEADGCWSWHDGGHSVGWVRRRQAHEALIHRIDAELAAGSAFTVDPELAADGVDEILRVMLDAAGLPEWTTRELDGATAVIEVDGGAASWAMALGRFHGTSPNTGNTYDDPALWLVESVGRPTATLRGSGTDIDLWLWGRGSADGIEVEGDPAVVDRIRIIAAEGTQ